MVIARNLFVRICNSFSTFATMTYADSLSVKSVTENRYEFVGPMIDVYHVSPHETQNPDEFVTEVRCPVHQI